jgi:hypothetical protein
MFRLIGRGKPDHPMADAVEVQRIFDALPAQDSVQALEELGSWHESVSQTEGFRPGRRIELLLAIDDAAQARVAKLTRDYLAQERPSRVVENRLWNALHGYWRHAGLSFARGVDMFTQGARGSEDARGALPPLLVRCLRALAQQIKWMYLRYGPCDEWALATFNKVYAFAEARKLDRTKTTVIAGTPAESTPQLEFLRGVMLGASSPEGLLPAQIDLAERLIAQLAGRFALSSAPAADLPYWIDLDKPMAPLRATQAAPASPGLRHVGAGSALAEVRALAERIRATDAVPAALKREPRDGPEEVLDVLEHLALYWSPQAPERRHQRHSVKSRLIVTNSLKDVIETLGGDAASLSFDGKGNESWIVENVSAGGFGAVVPQLKGDWLRVGALVAMQPEGGSNWVVGLVRRVSKNAAQQARVGIQTLSRSPAALRFAISGARSGAGELGVLLKGNDPASHEVQIAMRPGVFTPGQNLEAEREGRRCLYMPTGLSERGEDYEIARFRELVRES